MKMYRYKQTQRFRVIVGDACFYATARQIRAGVGDLGRCNAATQKALDALEYTKSGSSNISFRVLTASGIAGTWENLSVQLTES